MVGRLWQASCDSFMCEFARATNLALNRWGNRLAAGKPPKEADRASTPIVALVLARRSQPRFDRIHRDSSLVHRSSRFIATPTNRNGWFPQFCVCEALASIEIHRRAIASRGCVRLPACGFCRAVGEASALRSAPALVHRHNRRAAFFKRASSGFKAWKAPTSAWMTSSVKRRCKPRCLGSRAHAA